jgi:hypothetical protein
VLRLKRPIRPTLSIIKLALAHQNQEDKGSSNT